MISFRRLIPNRWARLAVVTLLLLGAVVVVGRQVWAYTEYRAARADIARYRFPAAREHLKNCLAVWSYRPSIWLLAGQTARRMEQYEMAEHCYAQVHRLTGEPGEDLQLERVLLQAQLDPDSKVPYLRGLIEAHHPDSVLILEALARGYLRKNRYAHAGFILHLWVEKKPDDPAALFFRGVVREELGPREEAVEDYRRVLELDPEQDEARLRLAKLLLQLARPAEARDTIRPLAERESDPATLVILAESEYALGNREAAEATARQILTRHPQHPDALVLAARTAADAERFEEAERLLREVIALRPSHFQAHQQLHRVLVSVGKEREAAAVKGTLDRMTRDIARLRDIFGREFTHRPEDPALYYEVGTIFLRAGETKEGVRWLEETLRVDPENRPAHQELAAFYGKIGDRARAESHAQKGNAR